MKAWLGKFIFSCTRAYDRLDSPQEVRSIPRSSRTIQERLEGNMPSLVAFRIENGFLIDSPNGMRYCKDAGEIVQAIVLTETKQKLGLSKSLGQVSASNGGF